MTHAALELEVIGDDTRGYLRLGRVIANATAPGVGDALTEGCGALFPWVARITGLDSRFGFRREFMHGKTDYSRANRIGSRGVYLCFTLPPGIYEVQACQSWSRRVRYFCRSENGTLTRMSREEVETHFPAGSESRSESMS